MFVLSKFDILTVATVQMSSMSHGAKYLESGQLVEPLLRFGCFSIYKMGATRHLGVLKIRNFVGR